MTNHPNRATTYTVFSGANGTVYDRGLSVEDAAHIILTHDGRDYEVRQATTERGHNIFELWTRQQVANIKWGRTVVYAVAETREAAEADIWRRVIRAQWANHPDVMTDRDYDAMLAEIASE